MASFRAAEGLDEKLARLMLPAVNKLTRAAADGAKEAAPGDKAWITVEDSFVRPEHRKANGQRVPENLRFTLDSPEYDQQHYGAGPTQMGVAPRDEDGFTPGNTERCRCETAPAASSIAEHIQDQGARVEGTRVVGSVTCDHDMAVDAEFGNGTDHGARYLGAGLRAAARKLGR